MEHMLEILKIVEGGLRGDRNTVIAYTQQLANKAELQGESRTATRLRRAITDPKLQSLQTAKLVPVDNESRLSLAHEETSTPQDATIFLEPQAQERIDEFLRYVKGANCLLQNGLDFTATLLLYGPPGCGKTQLARYVAATLDLPLLTARLDSMVSSFLGSTAKNVRYLFDHAKSRPCVLFLDEFDSLAKLRDDQHEQGELKRVVVSLLQNIDLLDSGTILLAATNHPHLLDPAVWRRFAYKVEMTKPSLKQRLHMFEYFLGAFADQKQINTFALASENLTGAMIQDACFAAKRDTVLGGRSVVSTAGVLKRLLTCHNIAISENGNLDEYIRQARAVSEKAFTYEHLSEIFGRSTGYISNVITKGSLNDAT